MQRMTDDVHPRAQPVLAFLLTIAMAIWVGGSVMVDFAVVPTVFDQLSRRDAGDVGIVLFAKINRLESVLGAASILLAFAMGRSAWGTRTRHITATSLVVGMTVIAVIFLVFFTPAIGHRWTELVSSGVDLRNPADRPPATTAGSPIPCVLMPANISIMPITVPKSPRNGEMAAMVPSVFIKRSSSGTTWRPASSMASLIIS